MVSAVAEHYGLWDDEIFVTVVKHVTQAALPASLQLHERVCVNKFASSFKARWGQGGRSTSKGGKGA